MIGTRLGAYEIVEEIGVGGMATVYRAYQPSIARFVAVKVIHRSIATDTRAMERFQREARLIARLEHPHLLPIYDFDGLNDPPYIVMRYVEGGTLKDVLDRSGALPIADAVHILQQVALALDYAHRQGVIHRDIKPSNIMLDADGNIFLTDFGIARLAAGSGTEGITQTGIAVGTPGYMAPEQGLGADNVDQRADIYSMGVMLFQMLSGNMPYTAETPMGVMMKHITAPVPSILDFNPTLPNKVDDILTKALAKDPAERYQSASEFVEAVAHSGGDTQAHPLVVQQVARANVQKIKQQQAENHDQLDQTMAEFEQSRFLAPAAPTLPPTPAPATPVPARIPLIEDPPTVLTPTDQRIAAMRQMPASPPPASASPPRDLRACRWP